jgi:hypothetical protein
MSLLIVTQVVRWRPDDRVWLVWTPLCVWYHALRPLNGKGVHPRCCVCYRIVHSSDQLLANYRPSCCNQMPPQLWWLHGPNASVWWGPKHLPDARNCGQNNWPRKSGFMCTEVETELTRYKNSYFLVKRSIVTHWLKVVVYDFSASVHNVGYRQIFRNLLTGLQREPKQKNCLFRRNVCSQGLVLKHGNKKNINN